MKWQDKLVKLMQQLPKGKVTTYGRLAKKIGLKSARPVGNWLHSHGYPVSMVPCHRVVNSQGGLAKNFGAKGGVKTQAKRLKTEGVEVKKNKVDLNKYLWVS